MLSDTDLERRYLSRAFLDPATLDSSPVSLADFSTPSHRILAAAMGALRSRGEAVDTLTLRIELQRRDELDRVGGDEALLAFSDAGLAVTDEGAKAAASRIRELAQARRGREHALLAASAFEALQPTDARVELDRAVQECATDGDAASVKEAVESAIIELRTRAARTRPPFVATGIQALDTVIGGAEYGDMWVIGGDPSVGKSTTALLMAFAMDARGHTCGYVSCEDPKPRVGRRVLSMLSGVPAVALRKGDLSPWQWEALGGAVDRIIGTRIHVAYRIGEELSEVLSAVAQLRKIGCDVIFVDYAQAIEVPGVEERIGIRRICAQLKRECNRGEPGVLFLLSQLHRREDPTAQPTKYDLFGSSYLEQKADGIILLWRDEGSLVNGVLEKAKDDSVGAVFVLERDAKSGMLREAA